MDFAKPLVGHRPRSREHSVGYPVDRIESIMNPLVFDFRWSMRTLPISADVPPCD